MEAVDGAAGGPRFTERAFIIGLTPNCSTPKAFGPSSGNFAVWYQGHTPKCGKPVDGLRIASAVRLPSEVINSHPQLFHSRLWKEG